MVIGWKGSTPEHRIRPSKVAPVSGNANLVCMLSEVSIKEFKTLKSVSVPTQQKL